MSAPTWMSPAATGMSSSSSTPEDRSSSSSRRCAAVIAWIRRRSSSDTSAVSASESVYSVARAMAYRDSVRRTWLSSQRPTHVSRAHTLSESVRISSTWSSIPISDTSPESPSSSPPTTRSRSKHSMKRSSKRKTSRCSPGNMRSSSGKGSRPSCMLADDFARLSQLLTLLKPAAV